MARPKAFGRNQGQTFSGNHPPGNDAFAAALAEIEEGRLDKGVWARAFAESGGDESKAKAAYIKARAGAFQNAVANTTQPPLATQRTLIDKASGRYSGFNISRSLAFVLLFVAVLFIAIWGIVHTQKDTQARFALMAYNNKDYAGAITRWRPLAEQGMSEAQFRLGVMYATGRGVQQNDAEAVNWYRKAAAQGDVYAQFNLGEMYAKGKGVQQNDVEAVNWYRKAAAQWKVDAEQGDVYAQKILGSMYAIGRGVQQNKTEAASWYRKAAEQGDADAQYHLGYMYQTGDGVSEDDAEAEGWLRKSAVQGKADAQFRLGFMYVYGFHAQRNHAEAVQWFRKAAEQGHVDAQRELQNRSLQ